MHNIPFYLKFKIDSKVFSFKPIFINKSCRVWNLVSNKTSLVIFGFFYNLLWILQVSSLPTWNNNTIWGGGSLVSCIWVPRIEKLFTHVPLPAPDGGRPIGSGTFPPAARSSAGRGWLGTTYGTWGVGWRGLCSMGRGRARPAVRRGGGHVGVPAFPVRTDEHG
jgi:hypothetical protein